MTTITIDRALLEQALDVLITRGAQPGYETERAWLKIVKSLEAALSAPATAPTALAGQGKELFGQLIRAVDRLVSAQNELERFGCVGPSPSELARSHLVQLINHVCTGIDSPPAPATAPERKPCEVCAGTGFLAGRFPGVHYECKVCATKAQPATAPAWHDAPTVPGLWMCNYGDLSVATVNQPDIDTFDPAYNTGGRWYGPIPPDGDKP